MIAFKTFNQCPVDQRPAGIPIEWPWQEQTCLESEVELYQSLNFIVCSVEDYNNYKNQYQAAYDTWCNSSFAMKEKDYQKYLARASVKNQILAEMASENMSRVRAGIWTVTDLINLTQDTQLKQALDDIETLSFELAQSKLMSSTNSLLTTEIKNAWIAKLQANLFNG